MIGMTIVRREFLKDLGIAMAAAAASSKAASILSPLEAAAQEADITGREFDMLWKGKDDKYFAKRTAEGILLWQEVPTGDPNYKSELHMKEGWEKINFLASGKLLPQCFQLQEWVWIQSFQELEESILMENLYLRT